jgi:protein ImuB
MPRILYFQSPHSLTSFAEACLSLTPKVYVPPKANEVYLEISTTAHLFGGESGVVFLAGNLAASFGVQRLTVLVDRPEWARACAVGTEILLAAGTGQPFLHSLPLDRLIEVGDPLALEAERPEREALVAFMKRVGMRTIGDFARLSFIAVGRRFGKAGVLLQEWVQGARELVLPDFVPEAPIQESLDTEETPSLEALLFALRASLVRMESRLTGRALVARTLKLSFHLDSGERKERVLEISEGGREAGALLKLLREFLSAMHWDSPLTRLDLEVTRTEPFTPGQLSLFDKRENRFADLAGFVERLRVRFGPEAVGFPALQESYCPERSWKNTWPPPKPDKPSCPSLPPAGTRPLFLFMPPRPWQKPSHCQLIPTENLATEWWREDGGHRRYFIARTVQGEKLWTYWDVRRGEWFLQGTFD